MTIGVPWPRQARVGAYNLLKSISLKRAALGIPMYADHCLGYVLWYTSYTS